MIAGTAYGIVLNDKSERVRLTDSFHQKPYNTPPKAPVVYIKPRACFTYGGAAIPLPKDISAVVIAPTLAVLFAQDCAAGDEPLSKIGAACLAIDVSEPEESFYRPAIRQRCRDGFLPLGVFGAYSRDLEHAEIVTRVDGLEAHRWPLSRLVRPVDALVRDLASFMTLRAGDLLLVGLPGDAPRAQAGQAINVSCAELPSLSTKIEFEE